MWEEIKVFFRGLKIVGISIVCCLQAFIYGTIGLLSIPKYSGWGAIGLCIGSISVLLMGFLGVWAIGTEIKVEEKNK